MWSVDSIFRRFHVKEPEKTEALQRLIAEKNLSKDDLILILSTIELDSEVMRDID